MYSVCAFSLASFLLFAKNIVILEWTNWLRVFVCLVLMRPCLVPRRAFCGLSHLHDKGERVGKEARHNKGVYLTLCLRQLGISQIQSHYSLELSNGRCPGCDFFIPVWLYVSHHCILTDAVCFCVHIPHG